MVGGSLTEQLNNPELGVEASNPDLQTRTRRLHLRAATIRMKAAALGRDLELEDWGRTLGHDPGALVGLCLDLGPAHCLLSPSPLISVIIHLFSHFTEHLPYR